MNANKLKPLVNSQTAPGTGTAATSPVRTFVAAQNPMKTNLSFF